MEMRMLIEPLRLLAVLLSGFGLGEMFRSRFRVRVCFVPALVVSFQVTALVLAGLLNVLRPVSILLLLSGLLFLLWVTIRQRGKNLQAYVIPEYLAFLLLTVVLYFLCRRQQMAAYDNFTHWGLVTRYLLGTDRFPNFRDQLLVFTEYPLGAAAFLYYVGRLASGGEGVILFAQAYFILCCLLPVFSYGRKHWMNSLLLCLAANFVFSYNIRTDSLLVDTLLAVQGCCGLLFLITECGLFYGKETKGSLWLASLFFITTVQIKNSGLLFVGAALGLVLATAIVRKRISWSMLLPTVLFVPIWKA